MLLNIIKSPESSNPAFVEAADNGTDCDGSKLVPPSALTTAETADRQVAKSCLGCKRFIQGECAGQKSPSV